MSTILAQLDKDGAPVLVQRGQAVTLFHKLVEDEHDVAISLGAPIGSAVPFEVSVAFQTLDAWGPEDFARHCIQVVEVADPPALHEVDDYGLTIDDLGVISAAATFRKVPVPTEISKMQARLVLLDQGELDEVETAIASAPRRVQIYWQDVTTIHRAHTALAEMAAALGWASDKVDDLFRAGILES